MINSTPTPEEAQALLSQAQQTDANSRASASWPNIAGFMGMGAASSMAIPALAYIPDELFALPLILLMVWLGVLLAGSAIFGRSVKQGFGIRWLVTMLLWGVTWAAAVIGMYTIFAGETWFLMLASSLLIVVTVGGAWWEARQ